MPQPQARSLDDMPVHNLLLDRLASRDRRALLSGNELVQISAGQSLSEPGRRVAHVFFPTDSSISVCVALAGQPPLDVGLIGREGMLGLTLLFGASVSEFRSVVHGAGKAWRIDAAQFSAQLATNSALQARMNRYVHVRLLQIAGTAACQANHRVEARLAHRLLMARDRSRSDEIALTHELLAQTLGVRRAGVTLAARSLRKRGFIRYTRGHIELVDRRALESVACDCYENEKRIYARFMS